MLLTLLFIAQFSKVKGNDHFILLPELACLYNSTSENSKHAWGITLFPQNLPMS